MSLNTCFEHTKTSINQWLKNYNEGEYHCKDMESINKAGWVLTAK